MRSFSWAYCCQMAGVEEENEAFGLDFVVELAEEDEDHGVADESFEEGGRQVLRGEMALLDLGPHLV